MSRGRGQALETNKGSRLCAERLSLARGCSRLSGRLVFVLITRR